MACVGEDEEGGLEDKVSRLLSGIYTLLANSGSKIVSSISQCSYPENGEFGLEVLVWPFLDMG